jgi:hypothetical protein
MSLGEHALDAVAADAVAGELSRASKHSLPLGAPCPNCGTSLAGPWCHECGQKGEAYHRSILHLIAEAFEGLTHFDGRFWNTLPRLAWRPGKLTRDYLDGHRASQIPPFRMFLIVLLAVFFTGSLNFEQNHINLNIGKPGDTDFSTGVGPDKEAVTAMRQAFVKSHAGAWAVERVEHAIKDPEAVFTAMEHWSHQFAILMLPIAALMLSLLFAFRRGVYVFDHLIFSMHSLAFQGLLLSAVFLLGLAVDWAALLLWLAPVHLFIHMRGTYRTGVVFTLLRMFVLFIGTSVAFAFLMMGLVVVGLATAH